MIAIVFASCYVLSAWAGGMPQSGPATIERWLDFELTPHGPLLIQQRAAAPYRDYRMNRVLSPEERKRWCSAAMPMLDRMMQMDPCEAMNPFAIKMKARPGLAFDDVVQSLTLRANRLNLKYVGNNTMWQDFHAVLGDNRAPRVEMLSFCDIALARELLRVIPELVVFMPCRIAVMEDADKTI